MPRITRAVSAVGLLIEAALVRLARMVSFFRRDQESPSERNAWGNR